VVIPTNGKQFHTKVFNHIASILRVSDFFGHIQIGIRQRYKEHW